MSEAVAGASGEGGDAVREGGLRAVPAAGFQPVGSQPVGSQPVDFQPVGPQPVEIAGRGRTHRLLAGAAAVLAVAALAAGDPPSAGARVDLAALARTVEAEEDHVTAVELAAWIRDRKPGLRVVDVRGAEDFAEFHLPNAENLSLPEVARAPFRPDETVVLYSEGGTHAAQGWFFLRARGIGRVYFLRGGLYEWMTEVVNPTLPADATPAQRAEFARTAELSRYFGGVPRVGGSAAPARVDDPAAELPGRASEDEGGTSTAARRVRQRGC